MSRSRHVRVLITAPLAVASLALAAPAGALSLDPKAVARFDHSFAKCEQFYPQMKGGRDEAYLSIYRVKADPKTRAQLAELRKGTPYQAESRRVKDEDARKAPSKETLELQCRALWGETQRVRSLAPQ